MGSRVAFLNLFTPKGTLAKSSLLVVFGELPLALVVDSGKNGPFTEMALPGSVGPGAKPAPSHGRSVIHSSRSPYRPLEEP